ncbi:helix-turn-helix domain-containing protein [Paenibacillus sp. LMG 31459]|uniref:Helix-turn-helix domain-containing protein n=1 Tax=Paenibacillus phytohabitans TaxID=2654978 RepID=A0ABX1YR76_9BACL|nr:helix-turn-helix transcriptional regulator [Paenibacillus phytohabitans]NOU82794.1 helix-turn-helix domain-containing protein [Paenibacillus phytohabitans]
MIKNNLSEILGRQRLKVRDVVRGTGLATNTVSGLYHDTSKRVDLDTLDKLCTFLGVNVGEILEHVEEPSQD